MREKQDRPKHSFTNLLYYHRPLMIVDEAHKVVTELSQETQRLINPAAIIEFTATPRPDNNTLYNVRATELKEEEMIKLPIALVEHSGWEPTASEAIRRRAGLEKEAREETEYIRPLYAATWRFTTWGLGEERAINREWRECPRIELLLNLFAFYSCH